MSRSSVVLLILAIVGCTDDGFVGQVHVSSTGHTTAAADTPLTLERARQILESRSASAIGSISLEGYTFHHEVGIGNGMRVIAISRNLGGALLVFGANGVNVAADDTKEMTWLQLFDLDEDGVAEIVTEEIEGRGTGVLDKRFHVYRIGQDRVETLWTGESYSRRSPTPEQLEETVGFLRFDASGGGLNARLTHLIIDAAGRQKETTFEWRNGALQAR